MDRVKRISSMILEKHRPLFGEDFEKNKSILHSVTVIRSKQLRNRIAGYITAWIINESPGSPAEGSGEPEKIGGVIEAG